MGIKENVNFYARYTYGNRNKGGLKIMHWNAGGGFLRNKMENIEQVIEKYHPHIFGISESQFRKDHDINDIKINGYEVHLSKSLDNPDLALSRLAVYVHKDVQKVKVRHELMDNDFSSIWLDVGLCRQKTVLVGNVYREWQLMGQQDQSSLTISAQYDRFSKFIEKWESAIENSYECHLLGDLNLNFLEYNQNVIPQNSQSYKLRKLIDLLFKRIIPLGAIQCVTSATWVAPNKQESGLDHYFTNAPSKLSSVQTILNGASDHKIIYATRFSKSIPCNERIIKKRSFKNFDKLKFIEKVRNIKWWEIYSCDEVDKAVEFLSNELTHILDELAPLRVFQVRSNYAPWLSVGTKQWMKFRDEAFQAAIQSQSDYDWMNYRSLRNKVNNLLQIDKRDWKRSKLKYAAENTSFIWNFAKSWLGWKSGGPPTHLCVNGVMISKPYEIAQAMNTFFVTKVENIVKSLPVTNYDPFRLVKNIMKNKVCSFELAPVHPDQIDKIISNLKNSKSCGLDTIDCSVIKLAKKELVPAITHIVNLSFSHGTFPKMWKSAKIIPLHKKNDSTSPQNYRPVAILPLFSKILERAIFLQIVQYMEGNNLLHPSHHGFRKHHNTTTAVIEMIEQWINALDDQRISATVFLDLSAAFDVVDKEILLKKVRLYGFRENAIKWLNSYLSDRQQQVYIDGSLSEPLAVNLGVPQGSILGPLLYTIYTNDLPEVIHDHEPNHSIDTPFNLPCEDCGGICCFADDSSFSISTADPAQLDTMLKNKFMDISNYMLGNRLALNSDKTHFMVIASQNQHRRNGNFGVMLDTGSEIISPSESERILGLHVRNDLTWNEHLVGAERSIVKNLSIKINGLARLCSGVEFKTRKILANGLVNSNIVYMIQVYGQAAEYLLNILQVQQNRAARIVTRLGWETSIRCLLLQTGWLSVKQLYVYHSILLV